MLFRRFSGFGVVNSRLMEFANRLHTRQARVSKLEIESKRFKKTFFAKHMGKDLTAVYRALGFSHFAHTRMTGV